MGRSVNIYYSRVAEKELTCLPKTTAIRITRKIADNAGQPNPLLRAKALQGELAGKYRYRIGNYRAIFVIDDAGNLVLLTILTIKHRKDVYR